MYENVGTHVSVCVHVLEHVLSTVHTHVRTQPKAGPAASNLKGHLFFTMPVLRLRMPALCWVPASACEPGGTRPGGAGSPSPGNREAVLTPTRMITDTYCVLAVPRRLTGITVLFR